MANFAKIENNVVVDIIVADSGFISTLDGEWIEYSDSRPAYIGVELVDGNFVSPQPYSSWILDENYDWQPPTPKPEGNFYWDEDSLSWLPIPDAG